MQIMKKKQFKKTGSTIIVEMMFIILFLQTILLTYKMIIFYIDMEEIQKIIYYSSRNIVLDYNIDMLGIGVYELDTDKAKERIMNLIENNTKKMTNYKIKVLDLTYKKDNVTVKYLFKYDYIEKEFVKNYRFELMEI